MALQSFPQCNDIHLIGKELIGQLHFPHLICLNVADPIFFVSFIQFLQRCFQVCLDIVEEGLFIFTSKIETDWVSKTQRSSGSNDELSDFYQELEVISIVLRTDLVDVIDLTFNFSKSLYGEIN